MPTRPTVRIAFVALALVSATGARSSAQPVPAASSRYRVLRSTSGPEGAERGGRFLIDEPRSAFSIGEDKQALVYFEFEGPAGQHQLQGIWRDPQGQVALQSALAVKAANRRFGGYWSLIITDQIAPGQWTIEVSVDGEPTGSHSVQLARGARATAAAGRRVLSPGDAYQRAVASSVFVDALDPAGKRLRRGSGFFDEGGRLLTAFQVIDGASALRITLPDGQRVETSELLAWNRWQDWAAIKLADTSGAPPLPRAPQNSWSVGDHGYTVTPGEDGARVIRDLSVSGRAAQPKTGERLSLNTAAERGAAGAPVLNDYGEVIAVLGGSTTPGDTWVEGDFSQFRALSGGVRGTPIELVRVPESGPATALAELFRIGDFLPPVTQAAQVTDAGLGEPGNSARAANRTYEFAPGGQVAVSVLWGSKAKLKAEATVRLWDLDGKLLLQSKPSKVAVSASQVLHMGWQFSLGARPAGIYRLDVVLGDEVAWRAFLKIKD